MEDYFTPDEFDESLYDMRMSLSENEDELKYLSNAYRKLYNETIGSEDDEVQV